MTWSARLAQPHLALPRPVCPALNSTTPLGVVITMLHRFLNALILLPDRYCYQVPADLGLQADEVAFPNVQGQLLHGFWFKPVGSTVALERPQDKAPVVLFCPGTSGNLASHLYSVE